MKSLIAAALLLALAIPAHAETCTGRVKIDAVANELAGGRIAYVGECMFLPPMLPKRILRSCPKGSYCRVEGVSYSEGEVGPEINAFTSVKRVQPTRAKWYLAVDIYTHANHGYVDWSSPERRYVKHAFNSRGDCLARARTFRKQCDGLIADQGIGYSVAKSIPYCQQHPQQPEPALKVLDPTGSLTPLEKQGFDQERACAE